VKQEGKRAAKMTRSTLIKKTHRRPG